MKLKQIFDKIPEGKGCVKYEHFFDIYDFHFSDIRKNVMNILEFGVQAGGSMLLWREYFENSEIYGVDISEKCKMHESDRIKIFIGNQSDTSFLDSICKEIDSIDIIIDDASHVCEHQRITFEYMFPKLNNGGYYVIEDTQTSYWRLLGGYLKNSENFVDYTKDYVDCITSWAIGRDDGIIDNKQNKYNGCIESVHYYNSMIIFKKGKTEHAKAVFSKGFKG